jgi:DsbC/DsbD-like thiol-disulfide interchange protein
MTTPIFHASGTFFATIGLAFAVVIAPVTPASAADASPWQGDAHASVRLVAARMQDANGAPILRAGVEIRLAPGWKTYWRYPGDSGVPPRFDFAGSQNLKAAKIAWPAPHRFADADGQTLGYKEHVLFPLDIVPEDAGRPVVLHLKLDYAVCDKLCLPADASLQLALDDVSTAQAAAIANALRSVPKEVAIGAANSLRIAAVARDKGTRPERIVVDVDAPAGANVELFAEGPTPEWALPLPEAAGEANGHRRFVFALDGLPRHAKADGATLTLTAVSGEAAIETRFRLD